MAACLMVVSALATAGVAGAAGAASPAWSVQTSSDARVPVGYLLGLSCPSANACIAVGNYRNSSPTSSGDLTLAEAWNGTTWAIQTAPNPTGAACSVDSTKRCASFLNAVSCASASACTSVGYYQDGSGADLTLAEAWNGSAWSLQTVPNPSGATSSILNAVSCPSAAACTAVGYYEDGTGTYLPFAVAWNGSSWAIQNTPAPTNAAAGFLNAVSCTSSSACRAVGDYTNGSGVPLAMAEAWNGTAWSVQTIPSPQGVTSSVLSAVSCTSAAACVAVGYYDNGSGVDLSLADNWNGKTWTARTPPNPVSTTGTVSSFLNAVSCTSATACRAVGFYLNGSGIQSPVGDVWNGTAWALETPPDLTGASDSFLNAVSCISATACRAVGDFTNNLGNQLILVETLSTTTWTPGTPPDPTSPGSSVLNSVSCPSATACAAVGAYTNSSGNQVALAESGSGNTWAVQPSPNPPAAASSVLSGVSCPSATACAAVGNYTTGSGSQVALASVWNGSSWKVRAVPVPKSATSSVLNAVSCSSATACTAVGSYTSNAQVFTLVEGWNGSAWSVQPSPDAIGVGFNTLNGVWCSSSTACIAVGGSRDTSRTLVPLAEAWNGQTWSLQTVPTPTLPPPQPVLSSVLNAVSCTSITACVAVGDFGTIPGKQTLAESLSGTTWAVQTTPNPIGAGTSILNGVSCASVTACIAVGDSTSFAGAETTLAEGLSGTTWALQTSPNPTGGSNNTLNGLSCTSATACNAVGSYTDSSGFVPLSRTLVERYS
jgi:hypothetical protein